MMQKAEEEVGEEKETNEHPRKEITHDKHCSK